MLWIRAEVGRKTGSDFTDQHEAALGKNEVSSQDYQLQQNQNEQEGGYTESAIIFSTAELSTYHRADTGRKMGMGLGPEFSKGQKQFKVLSYKNAKARFSKEGGELTF